MRVLAIAPTGFFADYGCHVRIMGQLRALQQLGHEVRLVTYPAGREAPGLRTFRPPVPLLRTMPVGSSRRKVFLDALLAPMVLAVALRFQPDVIHAYLHEGALMGWAVARLMHRPLTFDYQGSLTAEMLDHRFLSPASPFLPTLRRLEKWIERRPEVLFPSSAQTAVLLTGRGVAASAIHPLPDNVDPEMFAPRHRDAGLLAALGLDPSRPIVVYLGLLAWYQGTDLLLHALAEPPLAAHPAQFLIMGFPAVDHYRSLAQRLGVDHRVWFTGPIPYSEAPRYLALGDLAVAPKLSLTEGSGKLLPYMSMALPIVATDTPVHREYLGDDAVLVSDPEPAALAQALAAALTDLPNLKERALWLRHQVEMQYTWTQGARLMEAVFRSLT